MSTWLSKMNNGGIRGGMKVKEPIVPGLNTSAAKVSKTKAAAAAVNTAKIAADGDKADKEAETNDNNSFANKLKGDQIAKDGDKAVKDADAAAVADTSYITKATPKKKANMTSNLKPNAPSYLTDHPYTPPTKKPKPSGGKIAPVIVAAAINAISKKKK